MASETVDFPAFDFKSFYKDGIACDCTIIYEDKVIKKCHQIILANSSKFFLNIFTSNMKEQETGEVNIEFNPGNLLPKVIEAMYDGKISYEKDELFELYAIVHFYGIEFMKKDIEEGIEKAFNEDLATKEKNFIFNSINKCYELDLQETLNFIAPLIGKNIQKFDVSKLSEVLDIRVYALALKEADMKKKEKEDHMNKFLNGYEPTIEENEMLKQALELN